MRRFLAARKIGGLLLAWQGGLSVRTKFARVVNEGPYQHPASDTADHCMQLSSGPNKKTATLERVDRGWPFAKPIRLAGAGENSGESPAERVDLFKLMQYDQPQHT